MGKQELVREIANATGITQLEVQTVIDAFLHLIAKNIAEGKKVTIKGFGSFFLRSRAPRTYIHPETGQPIHVAASVVPVFRPSDSFREYVVQLREE